MVEQQFKDAKGKLGDKEEDYRDQQREFFTMKRELNLVEKRLADEKDIRTIEVEQAVKEKETEIEVLKEQIQVLQEATPEDGVHISGQDKLKMQSLEKDNMKLQIQNEQL